MTDLRLVPLFCAPLLALAIAAAPVRPVAPKPSPALVAQGGRVFARCAACHAIEEDEGDRLGPNLYDAYDRSAAARPGYAYSAALKKAGLRWNDATLDKWLTAPAKTVPGTKMAFAGLASAADRAAVIAYLRSNSAAK